MWPKGNGQFKFAIFQTPYTDQYLSQKRIEINQQQCRIRRLGDLPPVKNTLAYSHIIEMTEIKASILILNDDCLEMIFRQDAISYYQLGKLAYVCRRFNNIIAGMPRDGHVKESQYAHIRNTRIWKSHAILSALGSTIKYASVYTKSDTMPAMLMKYCPIIEHFELCAEQPPINYILKENRVNKLPDMRFVHYSQHLDMSRYTIPADLPMMLYAERPHIVQLNLYGIDSISTIAFKRFVKANKSLRQVNFTGVSYDVVRYADHLINCFPNEIEKLTITREKYLNCSLLIRQYADRPRSSFIFKNVLPIPCKYRFSTKNLPHLKYLKVSQIKASELMPFIRQSYSLEELHVISDEMTYHDIWKIIKASKVLKKATFTTSSDFYDDEILARINRLRRERGIELFVNIRYRYMNVVS